MHKMLYFCYFGLREPLVQTQVLPYLRQIIKDGFKAHLLTFEPNPNDNWTDEDIENERRKLADENIEWIFLRYHKTPSAPATLFDVLNGARFARKLAKVEDIDIFHGRVHIPTLMGWLAKKSLRKKPKLLFDIRGFFPEEYVDAGIWKKDSRIYKSVKLVEKWLLRDADAFITLTEKAREILFPEVSETGFDRENRPVEVIPCCVDLDKFKIATNTSREEIREKLGIGARFTIVYVGSFGGFYMTEEMADFYRVAKERDPSTFALILTQSPREMIEPLLKERGFTEKDYFIQKVKPNEIPLYLSAADAAVSFIMPSYSKQASSPTKNAEYLACGLPIVVNDGIGDTTQFILEDRTGVLISEFSAESYNQALDDLDRLMQNRKELAERCKKSAKERFDLIKVGGARYRRIYQRLLEQE